MKGINVIFTSAARVLLTLALVLVCLPGCRKTSTFDTEPAGQDKATVVTLRITAGETPATRVDFESENSGESFENYIDINTTHILFFINDILSEEFVPDEIEPVGTSEYPVEWNLTGAIQNPPTSAFKVVVLANCTLPELTVGATRIVDLCKAAVYTAYSTGSAGAFQPSESTPVPMYGVQSYSEALTFRPNIATNLGQIDLLRAMAKVVIRNTSGKSLQTAAVAGYNLRGTVAPLGLYTRTGEWALHANAYDNLSDCLAVHLPGEATANESNSSLRSVSLVKASATEDVWTGYFPEYLNANTDGEALSDCSSINLKFAGLAKDYTIDFRYYSSPDAVDDGKRFDLKRNHIYEFDITKVDAYSLNMTLIAKPWTVEEFSYSYSDNVTALETGWQEWTWASDDSEVTPDTDDKHKLTFSGAGSIKVTFTIDTPLGADWIAVFEQKSGDLNHFSFADSGTDRTTGTVDGNQVTLIINQNPETNGKATLVIYAHYGNVSFKASSVLGGEYVLEKY